MKVIYCGFFIERGEFLRAFEPKLARAIEFPHITTAFRPGGTELHEDLLGREIEVCAAKYGNDGRNEGIVVGFRGGDERAKAVFNTIALPHITISVAEDAKPVDTAQLDFTPCEEKILRARYGWFYSDRDGRTGVYFGAH